MTMLDSRPDETEADRIAGAVEPGDVYVRHLFQVLDMYVTNSDGECCCQLCADDPQFWLRQRLYWRNDQERFGVTEWDPAGAHP